MRPWDIAIEAYKLVIYIGLCHNCLHPQLDDMAVNRRMTVCKAVQGSKVCDLSVTLLWYSKYFPNDDRSVFIKHIRVTYTHRQLLNSALYNYDRFVLFYMKKKRKRKIID